MRSERFWKEKGFVLDALFPEYSLWCNKHTGQTLRRYFDGMEMLTNLCTGEYEVLKEEMPNFSEKETPSEAPSEKPIDFRLAEINRLLNG